MAAVTAAPEELITWCRSALRRLYRPAYVENPANNLADQDRKGRKSQGRIERVHGWAAIQGLRKGDNPARWRGLLEHWLPNDLLRRQRDTGPLCLMLYRDWAAEQTDYPAEVAEMGLAHVVGDKVEADVPNGWRCGLALWHLPEIREDSNV